MAEHYDGLDLFYRRVWSEQLHHRLWRRGDESWEAAARALAELVGERLGLEPGDHVCDVGCGYGAVAARLAAGYGARVTGITNSRKQAERAVLRADDGVEIRFGDWLDNGLPDGAFDAVLAVESLEHMADPARAVAEMDRVVKPGGRILLCCWQGVADARRWERRHLLEPIRRHGGLVGMGTAEDVLGWIRDAGLTLEQTEDFSREVERTWPWCIRRSVAAFFFDAELRRLLLGGLRESRAFALTLLRIWAAYVLGAMRYIVFTARKPG